MAFLVVVLALLAPQASRAVDAAPPDDSAAEPVWEYPASAYPVAREWREYVDLSDFRPIGDRALAEYERRVQACMAERGFEYIPIVPADSDPWYGRAFNPLNEAAAAQFGYHLPPMPQAIDRNPTDAAFVTALAGTEEDQTLGCADPVNAAVSVRWRRPWTPNSDC